MSISARAIPGSAVRYGMLPELPVLLSDVEAMQTRYSEEYPGRPREEWE